VRHAPQTRPEPTFDAAPCGPRTPSTEVANDQSPTRPQHSRSLAHGDLPIGYQAQHRDSDNDVKDGVGKRQLLDPPFEEQCAVTLSCARSRGGCADHRLVGIDADSCSALSRERCGELAVATAEIEHTLALDRSHEFEDATLLEGLGHPAKRRCAPPGVRARAGRAGHGDRRLKSHDPIDVVPAVGHYSNIFLIT
jgi:hypothetical protein